MALSLRFFCFNFLGVVVAGRRTRRETDRLCSDNEEGARDDKAEK
jgi:hypothetical protein